ncbi:exo-beta-1,3-glucanase [Russula earlei]|uniref:Exo-beta-1,3-glucanase n=1 Tax=Russula earlei TaxID=71964 RepID=A0ACC0UDS8_9AGAM|nr:exo-beta-1,3-glucanase [Russula earlei]
MSRLPISGDDVPYHPVLNPQDLHDLHEAPYDPPPQPSMPSTPTTPVDLNPDEPSVSLVRPRFLGSIDGEGIRQSFASLDSRPQSDRISSLYALNQDSLSSRGTIPPGSEAFSFPYRDDPRSPTDDNFDGPSVPMSNLASEPRYLSEKEAVYSPYASKSRRNTIILSVIAGLILLIVAVVLPVYFLAIKHTSNRTAASQSSPTATAASPSATNSPTSTSSAITGGDGSVITMEDGTTFTYSNPFGGFWYYDPNDPFNNAAQAQSWTPPLNQSFKYGSDRIRGVNIGGWLVTEPFITPALYQKYPTAVDEWTLSLAMASDTASGGLSQLEQHYKTFITEQDFAEIAGAGLNYVRIPLPYWAIDTWNDEPFLKQTCWTYFLKAIKWARKYGLRINLDFHSLPGSQNGWNHSGRLGTINVLNGPMGLANAQRSLDYIRILAEFISQPQYKDVVTMFGITNEPQGPTIGINSLSRYYLQAYNNVRLAGGTGAGNGPMISFHDGFLGSTNWAGFLPGADRIALDLHPYVCFGTQTSSPMSALVTDPCTAWGGMINKSMSTFGLTGAGEFSNAINDCGLFVNGVNMGTRYEGTYNDGSTWPKVGDCGPWEDYTTWSQALIDSTKQFALASMDALQNYFFWTWKIGNSTSNAIQAPSWSYKLGLDKGWMPTDPREADGVCGNSNPWQPPLAPSQTGGSGAGQIPATVALQLAWPPTTISNAGAAVTLLPHYTHTGTIPTLPVPTFTSATASINAGNGWENPADTTGFAVPIATCTYPDSWMESGFTLPPACGVQSTGFRRDVVRDGPSVTPAPILS